MAVIERGGLIQGVTEKPLKTTTILTSAQVLDLHNTPIEVLPAPGLGRVSVIEGVMATKGIGTAYGGIANTEDLEFRYVNAAGREIMEVETLGFLDQANPESRWTPVAAAAVEPVDNGAVVVRLHAGILTGTCELVINVYHRVVDAGLRELIKEFTLTSAQILDLHNTPVEVLAAPGVGSTLELHGVQTDKPSGTAYSGIAGTEDLEFRYTDAAGAQAAEVETTGFLDETTAQSSWTPAAAGIVAVENSPIVVRLSGAILTGDSDVTFKMYYGIG